MAGPVASSALAAMSPRWSDPNALLRALTRILAAPRGEALDRLADEIADLVPHTALALRTADCARSPVKTTGSPAVTELITADELHAIAARSRDGATTLERVVLGGEPRDVVVAEARPPNGRGALLVVLPSTPLDPEGDRGVLDLLAGIWSLVAAAEAARADDTGPNLLTGNQAAADARAHTAADLRRAHTTTLLALLEVLRSPRRDDSTARSAATDLASQALVDLRRGGDDDRALATETAHDAFDALRARLATLRRAARAAIELAEPENGYDEDRKLPQSVAIAARAATETLVGEALEQRVPTRIRVAWIVTDGALRVSIRDDGDVAEQAAGHAAGDAGGHADVAHADDTAPRDDRVAALGGRIHLDAVPGWGTTTTVVLPLDPTAPTEPGDPGVLHDLGSRELEVLAGLSSGLRNREIAARLHLSEHTVKFHVRNVLDKLHATNRAEAAAIARDLGVTPVAPLTRGTIGRQGR